MKFSNTNSESGPAGWLALLSLAAILAVLFWRSFLPDYVHFSNDGPLGQQMMAYAQLPGSFTGSWSDATAFGMSGGTVSPTLSLLFFWAVGPVALSKFFTPFALMILGTGAWCFFRQLKLSPLAALLGALAAMLNGVFFAAACWGLAPHEIAIGMDFFALAFVVANTSKTPGIILWARLTLAGLCVGTNVMEAADIGALFSLFIAAFVFFKSLADADASVPARLVRGVSQAAVLAVSAGFIASQTVFSLVGSQIQGIAGTAQDSESKAHHWDWATQWSLPKQETLSLVIPGLFGYKMDTPNNMMPQFQDFYRGGVYWGGVGRSPELDRYFDGGSLGVKPSGPEIIMRFSGDCYYDGILVVLIGAWAVAQSLRRENSPFTKAQKKSIWFWAGVSLLALPLAWGRFAPFGLPSFYEWLYFHLPGLSTVRIPSKFLLILSWAVVILFGYGVHDLSRRYLLVPAGNSKSFFVQLLDWWAKTGNFERKWTIACLGVFGAGVLGWFIYASEKPALVRYLQARGFSDEGFAQQISAFSIGQVGWWLAFFAVALLLLTLVMAGCFAGSRSRWGGLLLGGFLILDLGRADLPYIIHWDYKQKYEVGSLNPVLELLKEKPYEHRVVGLPFRPPQGLELLDELYRIEWTQHLFVYYNIQSLDIIQMPRMPQDLKSYLETLSPHGTPDSYPLFARQWQLTNTRYLLGAAGYLDILNQQLDPGQHRFRIAQRFEIVPKPGVTQATQLEELSAATNENGPYALFEFTGALPRAKLYSNWQVNTNDHAVLNTLADLNFDPAKTLLVDTPQKNLTDVATNENSGTVEYTSYAPKTIVFAANALTPSVLLLNDKYDPSWRVIVDGQPAQLLRCNYIMRGVYLPPGAHTVKFEFILPHKMLYVTLAAIVTGFLLVGLLIFLGASSAGGPGVIVFGTPRPPGR